jgi:hypothetical protein
LELLSPRQHQALSKGERAHQTLGQVFQALDGRGAADCTAICTEFRKFVVDESKELMYIGFACPDSLPLLVEKKLGDQIHQQFNSNRAEFAALVLKLFADVAFDGTAKVYKESVFKAHAAVQFSADACGIVQAQRDFATLANIVVNVMGMAAKMDKNKAKLSDAKSSKMYFIEYNQEAGGYVRAIEELENQIVKMNGQETPDAMDCTLSSLFEWLGVAEDAVFKRKELLETAMEGAETIVNERTAWMMASVVAETIAVAKAIDGLPDPGADDAAVQAEFIDQVVVKKVMEANEKLASKLSKVR